MLLNPPCPGSALGSARNRHWPDPGLRRPEPGHRRENQCGAHTRDSVQINAWPLDSRHTQQGCTTVQRSSRPDHRDAGSPARRVPCMTRPDQGLAASQVGRSSYTRSVRPVTDGSTPIAARRKGEQMSMQETTPGIRTGHVDVEGDRIVFDRSDRDLGFSASPHLQAPTGSHQCQSNLRWRRREAASVAPSAGKRRRAR